MTSLHGTFVCRGTPFEITDLIHKNHNEALVTNLEVKSNTDSGWGGQVMLLVTC